MALASLAPKFFLNWSGDTHILTKPINQSPSCASISETKAKMAQSKLYNSKDLTQCGICLLTLQEPKALPCLHSFCVKCLSHWAKGKTKVTCPLCVQEFDIPSDGVKAFRTNFFINTLKEHHATSTILRSGDPVVPCASCGTVDNKIEGHCSSCNGFICGDCVSIHSKLKTFSSHKVIPYADLRSGKIDIRNLHQTRHCKVHVGQVLWFFCETCGELICRDCTVVDHPAASHTLVNVENAYKGQKTEIEQFSRSCVKVQKKIADTLKEVDGVSEQLERNARTAEEEINKAFNRALRLLEDNRNRLRGEVKTIVSKRKKQIQAEKEEVQLQQIRLMTTLQMATEVVQTGSEYDLALVFSSLKSNLTTLCSMKPRRMKRNLEDVSFKPAKASQQGNQNLGSISSRFRRVKEGVRVWKLEREFGKDDAGKLERGRGVAMTQQGDLAITDYCNSDPSIKFFNRNGDFKSKFAVPSMPWDVAVSPDDRMFVTNMTKHVSAYDVEGNLKQQFPAKSPDNVSSDAQDTKLWSLAIDDQNNLLVGECNQKYISKHRLDGTHVMSFKVTIQPIYIAVSPQDKIIVSSCNDKAVHIVDENGVHLHTLKPPQGLSSWNPWGMCCTSDDEVYVANCTSSGSIHSYSTETGDYIGCIIKDVTYPSCLALMDDENKLVVAGNYSKKIFHLQ